MVVVVGTNMITGADYKVETVIVGRIGDYNEYELRFVE